MQIARQFLHTKILGLSARLKRLARIDNEVLGLRAIDLPYAASAPHRRAANQHLARIEQTIRRRYDELRAGFGRTATARTLIDIALVERELDRARRAFGMFFEVFAQRGTSFGPALAAHDAIAEDCYTAIRQAAPRVFTARFLKPLCYMEHGYSPATMRRGVQLSRLLGEPNPFPLIRIPWDRDQPWQPVFLHEVAHNLQADLGIWQENRQALMRRLMSEFRHPMLTTIYGRWHKEIFADLAALLLAGPAAAWGMAEFLAHPAPRVLTYRPGAHPTGYLRVLILAEMLQRMGFARDATRLRGVWNKFYTPQRFHRMPTSLLGSARHFIPIVVDEIAFQTRRNLAQRALVDIMPFSADDQARIQHGARTMIAGQFERLDLPPRFVVSAAAYALASGRVPAAQLASDVIGHLNQQRLPLRVEAAPVAA